MLRFWSAVCLWLACSLGSLTALLFMCDSVEEAFRALSYFSSGSAAPLIVQQVCRRKE